MTLNGIIAVILRYFSEFGYLSGVPRKSSRSLSHLLMSSCLTERPAVSGARARLRERQNSRRSRAAAALTV